MNWERLAWRSLLGLWFMIRLWRGIQLFVGDKWGLLGISTSKSLADSDMVGIGMTELRDGVWLTIAELVFLF